MKVDFLPDIKVLIEGGKATAAAPLGPALGPLGVDIGAIVSEINQKTKNFSGIKVPVTVSIKRDKSFEIKIGTPPASALIAREAGIPKGTANPKTDFVGNLSMQQVKKLAEMKSENLNSTELKKSAREIIGTCQSMGVTIEGKKAKDVQKEFTQGKYDSFF